MNYTRGDSLLALTLNILLLIIILLVVVAVTAPAPPPPMHVLDQPNCTAPDVSTLDDNGQDWTMCPDSYRKALSHAVIET